MASMPSALAVSLPYTEVESRLRTNIEAGLSSSEARQRQAFYGVNDFHIDHEEPLWKKYICQVKKYSGCYFMIQLYIIMNITQFLFMYVRAFDPYRFVCYM